MDKATQSRVFFSDIRANVKRSLFDKLDALIARVELKERFSKGRLIAVKLHFGEKGNTSFIRPNFVRRVMPIPCMWGRGANRHSLGFLFYFMYSFIMRIKRFFMRGF